jgi:hypothetical protein
MLCLQDPAHVVNAIVDALTDTHPPQWYFPGNGAKILRYYYHYRMNVTVLTLLFNL